MLYNISYLQPLFNVHGCIYTQMSTYRCTEKRLKKSILKGEIHGKYTMAKALPAR